MSNKQIKNLPKLSDLYEDNIEIAFKNDKFNFLVNQNPKNEWIGVNGQANNSKYIPIGIVETLLQKLFKKHKIEVISTQTMFNSIAVTVRVHYWSGIDNEWNYHDGVGAVELQTKKDTGVLKPDFSNLNRMAVMMALPMAKSYAIKDACEHIGRIFGRDLNRKDFMDYSEDELLEIKWRSKILKSQPNGNFEVDESEIQKECRLKLESINNGKDLLTYLVDIKDESILEDEYFKNQVLICKNRINYK